MKTTMFPLKHLAWMLLLLAACNPDGQVKQGTDAQTKIIPLIDTTKRLAKFKYIADIAQQDTLGSCEDNAACDNSNRWAGTVGGGGKEISPEEAYERITAFHNDHSDMIYGGFISKKALDEIFCHHMTYNGIYCYIAQDGDGNQVMIIEGWHDKDDAGKSRVDITPAPTLPSYYRYKTYMTETMCPTICGSVAD